MPGGRKAGGRVAAAALASALAVAAALTAAALLGGGIGAPAGPATAAEDASRALPAPPAFPASPLAPHTVPGPAGLADLFAAQPAFEENRGQAPAHAAFRLLGAQGVLVSPAGLELQGPAGRSLLLAFETTPARITGESPTGVVGSYFAPEGPTLAARHFASLLVHEVAPGIDLALRTASGELAFDLLAAPGADVSSFAFRLPAHSHAAALADGSIRVSLGEDTWTIRAPLAYQDLDGARVTLPSHLELAGPLVRLQAEPIDRNQPFVVDPVLAYSGAAPARFEPPVGIGADAHGNLYVLRQASLSDSPMGGACPTKARCLTIAKMSPTGTLLATATVMGPASEGPSDASFRPAFAVARDGSVAIALEAIGPDWPTVQPSDAPAGSGDAYVAVLDRDLGVLRFATYLSGSGRETPAAVTFDRDGRLHVAGSTTSSDLAPPLAGHGAPRGIDAFLATFDANGLPTFTATFGGSGDDVARAVSAPTASRVAVGFWSTSSDLVLVKPLEGETGRMHAAVVDTARNSATFLSPVTGPASAASTDPWAQPPAPLAMADDGTLLVTRERVPNPDQPERHVAGVARIDPATPRILWARDVTGLGADRIQALAITGGTLLATGPASSADFPTTPDALKGAVQGAQDLFVSMLALDTGRITYSTLLGGPAAEGGVAIAPVWGCGIAVAGSAPSSTPGESLVAVLAERSPPCTGLPSVGGAPPCPTARVSLALRDAPNGRPAQAVAWDFGDGMTGDGIAIDHSFAAAGLHAVRAQVTDDQGATWSVGSVVDACTGLIGDAGSTLSAKAMTDPQAAALSDDDHDGVPGGGDNCPALENRDQADADRDGVGDACDPDTPAAGTGQSASSPSPGSVEVMLDSDHDGVGDEADNCPANPNREQRDLDADLEGDVCDLDMDGDTIDDKGADSRDLGLLLDNCPTIANTDQANGDADRLGDACDPCPSSNGPDALTAGQTVDCPALAAALPPAGKSGSVASVRGSSNTATALWVGVGATIVAGGVAMNLRWRRGLPFLGFLGFSRLMQDKLLDQPVRRQIVDLVTAQPGIHPQGLVKQLNLTRGAVEHHLRILEKAGHVRGKQLQGRVCYFAVGQVDVRVQPAAVVLRSQLARRLVEEAMRDPGLSLTDLTQRLGCSYGAMLYHVDRLEEAGLVRRERRGGTVHLVPQTLGEQALAVVGAKPTNYVEAEGFGGK